MQHSEMHNAPHNEHNVILLFNMLLFLSLSHRKESEKEKNQVIEKNGRVFVKKKVNNEKNGST